MTTGTAASFEAARSAFSPAGAYSCRTGRKPIFKRGEISAIGPRRNIGASIAASVCRTIGGPVRRRMSFSEGELNAQSICDIFNSPLISDQIAGTRTTVGCHP